MRVPILASLFVATILIGCRNASSRSFVGTSSQESEAGATDQDRTGEVTHETARLRRLWSGSDFNFFASTPSPDGRYVTEIDWATGDLAVRDLTTGALHRLTDKGPWEASADFAEVARFSPDGRRIAYGWFRAATGQYEVRVMDFTVSPDGVPTGSRARVVHPGGLQYVFWLYGWTEEDELLAGIYRPDNSTALAFLSLETGSLRVLKSFAWSDPKAALSPDARLIAYDHAAGPDPYERDIYLLAADGSSEVALIERPGRDVVLGWTPSDGSLLFHSDASGSPSIWRQPMAGGQPSGPPQLLRADVRSVEPLGSAGHDLYLGSQVDFPSFRAATIDAENRRLVESLPDVDSRGSDGPLRAMAWSPGGDHFVHALTAGPSSTRMVVRAADGILVREWTVELRLLRWMIRWSPDGGSLIVAAQDRRGRAGFFRIDLTTGEADVLRRFDQESGRLYTLSPDGGALYFTRTAGTDAEGEVGVVEVVEREVATGSERVVGEIRHHDVHLGAGHTSPLAITPDGRTLAYVDPVERKDIWLLPVDGGDPRILRSVAAEVQEIVGWGPDGHWLYYLARHPSSGGQAWDALDVDLGRVSREGAAEHTLGIIRDYAGGAALHPDGERIAYWAGRARGEIWALETAIRTDEVRQGGKQP